MADGEPSWSLPSPYSESGDDDGGRKQVLKRRGSPARALRKPLSALPILVSRYQIVYILTHLCLLTIRLHIVRSTAHA